MIKKERRERQVEMVSNKNEAEIEREKQRDFPLVSSTIFDHPLENAHRYDVLI